MIMMATRSRALCLLACGALTLSCADLTGPAVVFLATIEADDQNGVAITAPDEVPTNETFQVRVVTYADRGCHERGPTEVAVDGLTATVRPFNRFNDSPNCLDQAGPVEHIADVRFAVGGSAEVVVVGMSDVRGDTIEVAHTVLVR